RRGRCTAWNSSAIPVCATCTCRVNSRATPVARTSRCWPARSSRGRASSTSSPCPAATTNRQKERRCRKHERRLGERLNVAGDGRRNGGLVTLTDWQKTSYIAGQAADARVHVE